MIVDINKQYQTRNGKKVRIYSTDAGGAYSVHGAIFDDEKKAWFLSSWTKEGRVDSGINLLYFDLIEVKPRIQRELWLNVYQDNKQFVYTTKEWADESKSPDRLACVKVVIDCEEGEGL